ncbi:zinc-ribbon domain-containing protein [Chryseobacterium sp. T1]
MALIQCNECGKEISSNAKTCPNCGSPIILPLTEKQVRTRKINKWIKYITLFLLVFMIYKCFSSQKEDEKQNAELITKLKEEHCKTEWNKIDKIKKEKILQEFIDNENGLSKAISPNSLKDISIDAYKLLSASTKYPGTIKVNGEAQTMMIYLSKSDAKIKNVEKGTIEYAKSFTAENKLGMEVKGTFWLTIKYNAGCKNYEVIDFRTE